mmetsp:Transcript_10572/g.20060  ORF Transcript_10572/g.20060 Transcript_10572/m.20060 type:complete len:221 (-) Transcript_10572:179-841(-)
MPPPRLGKYVEMAYTVTINLSVWIIPQLWRPLHYGIGIHSNQSSMRDLMPITRLLSRAAGLAVGLNSHSAHAGGCVGEVLLHGFTKGLHAHVLPQFFSLGRLRLALLLSSTQRLLHAGGRVLPGVRQLLAAVLECQSSAVYKSHNNVLITKLASGVLSVRRGSNVQACLKLSIVNIRIGTLGKKQFGHLELPSLRSFVKRRVTSALFLKVEKFFLVRFVG